MKEVASEKTIFENMGGTYIKCGDYYIPNLVLRDQTEYEIGIWGMRYKEFIRNYHKGLFNHHLMKGTLDEHIYQVDQRAKKMYENLIQQMAMKEGITEQLKVEKPMQWVGRMNNILNRAREIVEDEILV